MEDTMIETIKKSISNIRLSFIFKAIGNILFFILKIFFIPIIAICYFVSVGLEFIGKPLFGITSLLGSATILFMLWQYFSNGDMKPNIIMVMISAVFLGGLLLAIEYIPQIFIGIASLLLTLLTVWFK